ncbi:MAG TPA: phosphoribosylamine--glycine ligase [Kiritimatiellia bacterium]|nr:phosphoribosylamine--glycine ligase [Kiritimatiellia bacterium]HMP35688.1 phosphoribosylamine--glycine ligase [Kiritimatiellia bacterium]
MSESILLVGGGGREHALAWKISQDRSRPAVFCAPGNAGTATVATNLPIAATDLDGLVAWAKEHRPALTVIGPEAPLCAGLTDRLIAEGLAVFGPTAEAAQMEGSKFFSKVIMGEAGVPTAESASFTEAAAARAYVRKAGAPIVVKADGLAAGKGVTVCTTVEQAEAAIDEALVSKAFGSAGSRVVIEEFLDGEEASILALVDGERIVMLASSQDHKRIFDHDEGPNTGGMGAYSPAPVVTEDLWPVIRAQVFENTVAALRRRGITYRGVLYAGLMISPRGIKVLEFNCRFGDPECQAVLARWDGDLLPALKACAAGTLDPALVNWKPDPSVCVVMTAGGYPGPYPTGDAITGLDAAGRVPGVVVFHAGTAERNGQVVTAGGRVLGITATGPDLAAAIQRAYAAADHIAFAKHHLRRDIGWRALNRT